MHPFVLGAEYRRELLQSFVGSRQLRSGVLWGGLSPGALICTSGGRHGKIAGYADEMLSNGSWHYFGQGISGDHTLKNPANRLLAAGLRTILLFCPREPRRAEVSQTGKYGKLFRFVGAFNTAGFETVEPVSGIRRGDRLFRFYLIPCDTSASNSTAAIEEVPRQEGPADERQLREYLHDTVRSDSSPTLSISLYRARCQAVKRLAHLRAKGVCEACDDPAPFYDPFGRPFLEVHHITRLADDGDDAIENVAAICPNCHRRAHIGQDGIRFNSNLLLRIRQKESSIQLDECR